MRSGSSWPLAAVFLAAACAAPVRLALPAGQGQPEPAAAALLDAALAGCARIRTLTAELGVTGTVDGRRVRATVLAGTSAAGAVRLEAVAPFGAPLFVLAARPGRARLVLPRDARYVDAPDAAHLLDAVAGLAIAGPDLHALLAGCGAAGATGRDGERFRGGWVAVAVGPDARAWLRDALPAVRLEALTRPALQVEYRDFAGGRPTRVGVFASARRTARLVLRVSQFAPDVPLGDEAFDIPVPPGASPMTLDELAASSLLGG
jgi:hypothetical protein